MDSISIVVVLAAIFRFLARVLAQLKRTIRATCQLLTLKMFSTIRDRMTAAKAEIMKRQIVLLAERYDLSDHPVHGVVMDRTRPVQGEVRVIIENQTLKNCTRSSRRDR